MGKSKTESDLEWYFGDADGKLTGARSTWRSVVWAAHFPSRGGGQPSCGPFDSFDFGAMARWRAIDQRLRRLTHEQRRALCAQFSPRPIVQALADAFGPLWRLVDLTTVAEYIGEHGIRDLARRLPKLHFEGDIQAAARVRTQASTLLTSALRAYEAHPARWLALKEAA